MLDSYWSETSTDIENKKEKINNMSKEELLQFFIDAPIFYLELLDNNKLDEIIGEKIIIDRFISAVPRWQVSSQIIDRLLDYFTESNFINFINDYMMDIIKSSNKQAQIFQVIMESNNQCIAAALEKTPLLKYFLDNNDRFMTIYEKMSEASAISVFTYIIKYNEELITNIGSLTPSNQWAVINSITPTAFFKYFDDLDLLYDLDNSVKKKLIEKEPYFSYFINLPVDEIVSYILFGLDLPNNLSKNHLLMNKLATIPNPNTFRFVSNHLAESVYGDFRYQRKREFELSLEYHKEHNIPIDEEDVKRILEELSSAPSLESDHSFDTIKLEEKRKKYYDDLVNSLKDTNYMLPEYYDIKTGKSKKDKYWYLSHTDEELHDKIKTGAITSEDIDSILHELSSNRFLEILVDRYFEDITYNFLINLNNMVSFYQMVNIDTLGLDKDQTIQFKNRLELYDKILNFYELTGKEQVELYNSFDKSLDYATLFYEDYSLARNTAYSKMNECAFTPEKRKDLYNEELSSKYGVDVFEANGQEFYAYIHVTNVDRQSKTKKFIWNDILENYIRDPLGSSMTKSGTSLSLIHGKKLEAGPDGRTVNSHITVGFNYLIPERIVHISYGDSGSIYYRNGSGTDRINEIMMPNVLIDKTRKYNEILYQGVSPIVFDSEVKQKYEKLKPDFFVCYDEILEEDIALAKEYQLPILLVKTKKYDSIEDDYEYHNDHHVYYERLNQLDEITSYRRK